MTIPLKIMSVSAAILAAAPVFAGVDDNYYGYHHGMGWGGWFFGPVMMILFIGLIVAAIVVTARLLGFDSGVRSSDKALDILKERFAKGEIDKAEFEERRNALNG